MLLAGVAHVPILQFVSAIVAARGLRYFGEGWLAVRYGDQALTFIETNSRILSFGLASVVIIGVLSYLLWSSRRRASGLKET